MNISMLIIAAVMSSLFGAAQVSSPSTNPEAEQQARRASDEEVQAFLHKDVQRMADLWSDTFVFSLSNRLVAKREILEQLEGGLVPIKSYERKIHTARAYGDTVVLAGSETVIWGEKNRGVEESEHLRFTAVWIKQKGQWQEVARLAHVVPYP